MRVDIGNDFWDGAGRVSRETYRFLLRMPEELRDRLKESASRSNRSLNAEIVDRLGESLDADERSTLVQGLMARTATIRGDTMVSLRQRRTLVALGAVLVLALTAVLVGRLSSDGSAPGEAH